MSWITDRFPSKKMERENVLAKREMETGEVQIRIGYVRYWSDGPFNEQRRKTNRNGFIMYGTKRVTQSIDDNVFLFQEVTTTESELPNTTTSSNEREVQTELKGFLSKTQPKQCPPKELLACFSLRVWDNTQDDQYLVILDVYNPYEDRILAKRVVSRKEFPYSGEVSLFHLAFTSPLQPGSVVCRIYYTGTSERITAGCVLIFDPETTFYKEIEDILRVFQSWGAEPR